MIGCLGAGRCVTRLKQCRTWTRWARCRQDSAAEPLCARRRSAPSTSIYSGQLQGPSSQKSKDCCESSRCFAKIRRNRLRRIYASQVSKSKSFVYFRIIANSRVNAIVGHISISDYQPHSRQNVENIQAHPAGYFTICRHYSGFCSFPTEI